jgi:hypothetical protein
LNPIQLGIYIAMDGNQQGEVLKLRKKAEEFSEHIRTGFVSREEAWHSLNTTIMKTLEYPMEALSMTQKQWDYVMSSIIRSVLPKSGIARTFPHAILYALASFTGLGLIHPYCKQNL